MGFYIGKGIHVQLSLQQLKLTLKWRLKDARLNPYSIPMRVVVANQMVSSSLWYIIQLWPGKIQALEDLDRQIRNFVWSGQEDYTQPRVDYETLLLPKDNRGMGLILVKCQFCTLAGSLILWSTREGDQTLQHIIRKNLGDLSKV